MSPLDKKRFSIASSTYPCGNSNLDGLSLDIYFYGCQKHCKNCHNPELWEFQSPNVSFNDLEKVVNKAENAEIITLLGGDVIDSLGENSLHLLLYWLVTHFDKKICLYTYRSFDKIPKNILSYLDYIKTGEYDETKKTKAGSFLASSNQVMWKKELNKWRVQWKYDKNSDTNISL